MIIQVSWTHYDQKFEKKKGKRERKVTDVFFVWFNLQLMPSLSLWTKIVQCGIEVGAVKRFFPTLLFIVSLTFQCNICMIHAVLTKKSMLTNHTK